MYVDTFHDKQMWGKDYNHFIHMTYLYNIVKNGGDSDIRILVFNQKNLLKAEQ